MTKKHLFGKNKVDHDELSDQLLATNQKETPSSKFDLSIITPALLGASNRVINLSCSSQRHESDDNPVQNNNPQSHGSDDNYAQLDPTPERHKSDGNPAQPDSSPRLEGYSLFIFGPDNFIRKTIYSILQQKWLEFFLFMLLIVQLVVTAIKSSSPLGNDTVWLSHWTDYVLLAIFIILTIGIGAKSIAFGFILFPDDATKISDFIRKVFTIYKSLPDKPPTAKKPVVNKASIPYLRHSFNRIDLIAILFYWIDVVLMVTGIATSDHIYIFKTLSFMRTLRLLKTTPGTNTIGHSLKKSTRSLVNVVIFIAFFFVLFCIIGVQGFSGAFARQCLSRDPSQNIVLDQTCGGYYIANTTEKTSFITRSGTTSPTNPKGYICPMDFVCQDTGTRLYGTISFDTIYTAFVPVFVLMAGQTWTDLMYRAMDAEHRWSSLYFVIVMVIMNFWILNLFTAVINEVFSEVREKPLNDSAFTTKKIKNKDSEKSEKKEKSYEIYGHTDKDGGRMLERMEYFWVIVVIVDLIYLCLPQYDTPTDQLKLYENVEFWINSLFIIDIAIRITIFVPNIWCCWDFIKCKKNLIDLFLVMTNMIIQIPAIRQSENYVYLTIFQVLRIYRPIFLFKKIRDYIQKIFGSWNGILNVTLFIWLFLGIVSVMFGLMFRENIDIYSQTNPEPTTTFKSFYLSFLGVYQIFSGENWTEILYNVMMVAFPWHQVAIAALFVIAFYSVANFVLLNMLIMIIMENFELKSEKKMHEDQICHFVRDYHFAGDHHYEQEELDKLENHLKKYLPFTELSSQDKECMENVESKYRYHLISSYEHSLLSESTLSTCTSDNHPTMSTYKTSEKPSSLSSFRNWCLVMVKPHRAKSKEVPINLNYNRVFDTIITLAIIASLVTAAITTPRWHFEQSKLDPNDQSNALTVLNIVFPAIFTIEFLIRVIAEGFSAYMKSPWNLLDLFVLISMYLPLVTHSSGSQGYYRVFGSLKSLRALRLINKSNYMRDTFYAVLVAGFPQLLSAAALCLCLLVPFAIYGMHIFSGKFFSCNDGDASIVTLQDCMGIFADDNNVTMPRVWSNPGYNFDNFMSSILILFQLSSQEGWVGVMETARDIVGVGMQPISDASLYNSIYFVIFSYAGGLFVSSLFVAIVIENYTKRSGIALMTCDQKRWMGMKKLIESTHMSKSYEGELALEKKILWSSTKLKSGWFPLLFDVFTVIVAIALMSEYVHINNRQVIKNWMFMAIMILYMAENYIKIVGLGWSTYIWNRWNLFNGIMSALTFTTTILLICGITWVPLFVIQKLLLTVILLRLIPRIDALNELLTTLAASFRSIASLFGVWLVVFAVYGIMFMEIFSLTSYGPNGSGNVNFRTFGTTMLMMARMSTGEGWNDLMRDFSVQYPDCVSQHDNYLQSDCGSKPWAYSLFISFNVLSMYIFTNMFIGVVIHNFSIVYEVTPESQSPLNRDSLREFKIRWASIDKNATGYIEENDIMKFLLSLDGVFNKHTHKDDNISELEIQSPMPKDLKELLKLLEDSNRVEDVEIRRKRDFIYLYTELIRSTEPIPTNEVSCWRKHLSFILKPRSAEDSEDIEKGDSENGDSKLYGISFRNMLNIVARHKLVEDERWLSIDELIAHKQKKDEVYALFSALNYKNDHEGSTDTNQNPEDTYEGATGSPPPLLLLYAKQFKKLPSTDALVIKLDILKLGAIEQPRTIHQSWRNNLKKLVHNLLKYRKGHNSQSSK